MKDYFENRQNSPNQWVDYGTPKLKVGDKVYVCLTENKKNVVGIRFFCRAVVIGFYEVGYFVKITKVLVEDTDGNPRHELGIINSFHHKWVENALHIHDQICIWSVS